MTRSERNSRLIALAAAALVAFNFPVLYLFGKGQWLGNIPLLFLYLFVAWALLIGLIAWLVNVPTGKYPDRR